MATDFYILSNTIETSTMHNYNVHTSAALVDGKMQLTDEMNYVQKQPRGAHPFKHMKFGCQSDYVSSVHTSIHSFMLYQPLNQNSSFDCSHPHISLSLCVCVCLECNFLCNATCEHCCSVGLLLIVQDFLRLSIFFAVVLC